MADRRGVRPVSGVGEAEARSLIVRSSRVLERAGQGDMIWGHTSVRDDAGRGCWMKPGGLGFDEVTEDDVILVGWQGDVLVGTRPPHLEYPIHTEILRVRSDVNGVVHTHPVHALAFAATGWELAPLSHEGCQFVPPELARFTETTDVINTPERGVALAKVLGERNCVLMPGHGIATVGTDLGTAVGAAIHFERACQIHLLAGHDAYATSDEEAESKRNRSNRRFSSAWTYLDRVTNGIR